MLVSACHAVTTDWVFNVRTVGWDLITTDFGNTSDITMQNLTVENIFGVNDTINIEDNVDGTGYNVTAHWFNGLFNWTEVSDYLSFDGGTLDFNETELNSTIDSRALPLTGGSLSGNLNMTDNIIYNVSEIHFDNGFIIRGS
jgi:hypothetical protein